MNKKQLERAYKQAVHVDNLDSTDETKQARLNSLAELGRYSKARIKQAKEQQLNIFSGKFTNAQS